MSYDILFNFPIISISTFSQFPWFSTHNMYHLCCLLLYSIYACYFFFSFTHIGQHTKSDVKLLWWWLGTLRFDYYSHTHLGFFFFYIYIFSWLTDPSSVYPFIPGSSPCFEVHFTLYWGFPGNAVVKNPPANAGDMGLIPGWGRSPREGNGNPLQYSCLENPMEEAGRPQSMGSKRVGHGWGPNTLPYINVVT